MESIHGIKRRKNQIGTGNVLGSDLHEKHKAKNNVDSGHRGGREDLSGHLKKL